MPCCRNPLVLSERHAARCLPRNAKDPLQKGAPSTMRTIAGATPSRSCSATRACDARGPAAQAVAASSGDDLDGKTVRQLRACTRRRLVSGTAWNAPPNPFAFRSARSSRTDAPMLQTWVAAAAQRHVIDDSEWGWSNRSAEGSLRPGRSASARSNDFAISAQGPQRWSAWLRTTRPSSTTSRRRERTDWREKLAPPPLERRPTLLCHPPPRGERLRWADTRAVLAVAHFASDACSEHADRPAAMRARLGCGRSSAPAWVRTGRSPRNTQALRARAEAIEATGRRPGNRALLVE